MKAYIFPGQGSQFPGMGKDLYDSGPQARELFEKANQLLGFRITDIMFGGTEDELKQTKITQPAIFLHSVVKALSLGDDFKPDMVAGHSVGELSALAGNGALSFEDALRLVDIRANSMQRACEINPGTMAAVLQFDDAATEKICAEVTAEGKTVVAANYNCPGQLVISGTLEGVNTACERLKAAGAKRAILIPVGGAFHSPLMEPARAELEKAIRNTLFRKPLCPIYQNVNALPVTDPDEIRNNLIMQLTAPVKWTQTITRMIADGATQFIEVGPGKVLQGLVKKVNRETEAISA